MSEDKAQTRPTVAEVQAQALREAAEGLDRAGAWELAQLKRRPLDCTRVLLPHLVAKFTIRETCKAEEVQ